MPHEGKELSMMTGHLILGLGLFALFGLYVLAIARI